MALTYSIFSLHLPNKLPSWKQNYFSYKLIWSKNRWYTWSNMKLFWKYFSNVCEAFWNHSAKQQLTRRNLMVFVYCTRYIIIYHQFVIRFSISKNATETAILVTNNSKLPDGKINIIRELHNHRWCRSSRSNVSNGALWPKFSY